jgi:hypothetical protein
MPTPFDTLYERFVAPAADRLFGEPVTLQRGAITTPNVTASWTDQAGRIESADAGMVILVDRTWLVRKTAYLIDGAAVEPQKGDRLIDAGGAAWEVLPNIAGPAVTSYRGGHEWEIRTKRV